MTFDEATTLYHYPCPCGDRFEISLGDLRDGEDVAVCPSCSLQIKVIFEAVSTYSAWDCWTVHAEYTHRRICLKMKTKQRYRCPWLWRFEAKRHTMSVRFYHRAGLLSCFQPKKSKSPDDGQSHTISYHLVVEIDVWSENPSREDSYETQSNGRAWTIFSRTGFHIVWWSRQG